MNVMLFNCKDTCSSDDEQVWSIGGMRMTKENWNTRNMAWRGIEPKTPLWEASGYLPEQWYKPPTIYDNNYTYFCRETKTFYKCCMQWMCKYIFLKKIISLAFVQLKMYIQGFCNDLSRKWHTQYWRTVLPSNCSVLWRHM